MYIDRYPLLCVSLIKHYILLKVCASHHTSSRKRQCWMNKEYINAVQTDENCVETICTHNDRKRWSCFLKWNNIVALNFSPVCMGIVCNEK